MNNSTTDLARQAGQALKDRNRRRLVAAVKGLATQRAQLSTGWKALADPLIDYGELALARAAGELHVASNPGDQVAVVDYVSILARSGHREQAWRLLQGVPDIVPNRASNAFLRGTLLMNLGRAAESRSALLDAHRALPRSGQILHALAALGDLSKDEEVLRIIRGAETFVPAMPMADRASASYALGKAAHDNGEYDTAFGWFTHAGEAMLVDRPYDPALDRRSAVVALDGWTKDRIGQRAVSVRRRPARPILVTGLPRSGTTLVEQILVSHSSVSDGEELGRFGIVAAECGGTSARYLTAKTADDIAGLYHHLFEQRFGAGACAVDKSLEASRYLGMAASILPKAPIFWLKRDALEVGWSAFRTYFLQGLPWSSRLTDIAYHIAIEEALLARWQDVLGDQLRIIAYEDLVGDPAGIIPQIASHAGLDFEPAMLTPERTDRAVTTNSVMQVRRPINLDSVKASAPYRAMLQPFVDALDQARSTVTLPKS